MLFGFHESSMFLLQEDIFRMSDFSMAESLEKSQPGVKTIATVIKRAKKKSTQVILSKIHIYNPSHFHLLQYPQEEENKCSIFKFTIKKILSCYVT